MYFGWNITQVAGKTVNARKPMFDTHRREIEGNGRGRRPLSRSFIACPVESCKGNGSRMDAYAQSESFYREKLRSVFLKKPKVTL
jgi:hypothetical protein